MVDKAKEILRGLMDTGESVSEISEHLKESVRTHEITSYQGIPCGPDMEESDEIIIVEGRADILNLLKFGIRNTIALEGTSIPDALAQLTREKTSVLFVDGDRGGQLISRELFQKGDVDFVSVAPDGKEVEDLTKKEVFTALRARITADQFKANLKIQGSYRSFDRPERKQRQPLKLSPKEKEMFVKTLDELVGTRAACIYSAKHELLGKVPVSELHNSLKTMENAHTVIFDGRVDFRLNSLAKRKGIKFLVGMEKEEFNSSVFILSRSDLEK